MSVLHAVEEIYELDYAHLESRIPNKINNNTTIQLVGVLQQLFTSGVDVADDLDEVSMCIV